VERVLAGWTEGPRDDLRLTHPNMVPFDALDEETKDFDRDAIRAMPNRLRQEMNVAIVNAAD
jgi:hypothetical protein